MVKKAGSRKLKEALETHRKETEGQVDRLDHVFKLFDVAPRGKKCEAIEGILAEAKEHMEDIEDAEVLDAGMIGSAQSVEHYEITRYGTRSAATTPSASSKPTSSRRRAGRWPKLTTPEADQTCQLKLVRDWPVFARDSFYLGGKRVACKSQDRSLVDLGVPGRIGSTAKRYFNHEFRERQA
jgi:hypothetical protein